MNRRWLTLAAVFLLAGVMAFLLRDVVERMILAPLAYLWWVLRLYYQAFPQYLLWVGLILIGIFSALSSLIPEVPTGRGPKPTPIIVQGQIAGLTDWLNKSRRGGIYYKWLVANRLGKDAREILAQRDGREVSKKFGRLSGRNWTPPQQIDSYLETGLNGSFANYPQPHGWAKPQPTPLDVDPQQVIEYLENEMETSYDRNRQGI